MLDKQKTDQKNGSSWPDDWYVYDGEKVRGPLTAKETFSPDGTKAFGEKRMVSRKGFSQWYSLRDLSAIFNLTTAMGRRVEAERVRLERTLEVPEVQQRLKLKPSQNVQNLAKKQREISSYDAGGLDATPKQPLSRGHVGLGLSNSLAKPVGKDEEEPPQKRISSLPLKLSPADIDFTPPDGLKPSRVEGAKKSKGFFKHAFMSDSSWMRDYIYAKSHLRLGEIRQPWITGMLGIPLTLGVYWVLWVRDFSREIAVHSSKDPESESRAYILSALPLVHILVTYRLAIKMRELECENRYASTVPWIAALLSLFPPLAAVYLQAAANRHWFLHVRHAKSTTAGPEQG